MATATTPLVQRTFLGHPLGLYVLFFTEMWERFSYYGMRALLILYMTQYFRWSQQEASTIYKVYTSFVYITPILGGFLADRYLGNRWAVIIGATLMAIGHFLMAFEEYNIFLAALIFLILGNGMFKPNMSTQVGRLYPTNDGRRDAAYTIFYMGINLGAFLAPITCGWLKDNTVGGFHAGFTMAGIGMVIGLVIYLLGQPLIHEIDDREKPVKLPAEPKTGTGVQTQTQTQGVAGTPGAAATPTAERPLTEAEAANTPSVLGSFSVAMPTILYALAAVLVIYAPIYYFRTPEDGRSGAFWDALMLGIGGGCLALMGYVCAQVQNALRDRVLAILIIGVFVMFFWAAFEQAGNVLNLWAENNTNRYLWKDMQPLAVYPEVIEDAAAAEAGERPGQQSLWQRFSTVFVLKAAVEGAEEKTWGQYFEGFFNPISTESFQSINALAIFVIAPIFAYMWIFLDRKNMQPSIALKMFFGLLLMALSVSVMIGAARGEDQLTTVAFDGELPPGVVAQDGAIGQTDDKGRFTPFHAGRFRLIDGQFQVNGVLPLTERDEILGATAPASFKQTVEDLAKKSKELSKENPSISATLVEVPPGFDFKFAGLKSSEVSWNPETRTLTVYTELRTREQKGLLVAAAEPNFRNAVVAVFVKAGDARVSGWWLFWSYILATLGELCLSPVGLSMVNKLAPRDYSTMLMGVWMLTSAFGNFAAGAAGEYWGTFPPDSFFIWLTAIVSGAAIVLLLVVRLLVGMMHGVK
jgi:POT family proton-dependent oligopeptide transporter